MQRPAPLPLVVAIALAGIGCDHSEPVINIGDRIRHDDFQYSVKDVIRTDRIGERRSAGTFFVVTFVVENRAGRVGHRWTQAIAYVTDASGVLYEHDPNAERALARQQHTGYQDEHDTPAGLTDTTAIVFDLPKDVREPSLKVRGEFLMGDMFDGNRYARTRVRLF